MVKYTLTYYNFRGRGEVARILFAMGGIQYTDKRLQMEEWPKIKAEMPLGQIPVLEIDNIKINQSSAVNRYIAKQISAFGANDLEEARIDMIQEASEEFVTMIVKAKFNPEDKDKSMRAVNERAPIFFKFVDSILDKSKSGFLVGDKVSVADITIFHYLESFIKEDEFPEAHIEMLKHKKILNHKKKIENLPKVKEYLASRPAAPY